MENISDYQELEQVLSETQELTAAVYNLPRSSNKAQRALLLDLLEFGSTVRQSFDKYLLEYPTSTIDLPIQELSQSLQKRKIWYERICGKALLPSLSVLEKQRLLLEQEDKALDDNSGVYTLELRNVIQTLRHAETLPSFQSTLLIQQRQRCKNDNYSIENFAYGTTPFATWKQLFTSCSVLQKSVANDDPTYVVLGSSTGLLVFYAAYYFGLTNCIGYEILECLVATATKSIATSVAKPPVFHCKDFLTADLSKADIIMLASQCWDPELISQVVEKLEAECTTPGKIIIDYRMHDFKNFAHIYECYGKVSWNERQAFHVFERK